MTSQLQTVSKMRNVYKMTFDLCALGTTWRKRTTVPAGHVDSADVWTLDTMRSRVRRRCSFTNKTHATCGLRLFSSMFSYTQKHNPPRQNWQADTRICFWDPLSPPEWREHAMIWACNGRDDTPCCAESSLRRVQSGAIGLPCFPVAETLPRRDDTQFREKSTREECHGCTLTRMTRRCEFYISVVCFVSRCAFLMPSVGSSLFTAATSTCFVPYIRSVLITCFRSLFPLWFVSQLSTKSAPLESECLEERIEILPMAETTLSPTMRHVSRTHRVALDWLFDRNNIDTQNSIQIRWYKKNNLPTS